MFLIYITIKTKIVQAIILNNILTQMSNSHHKLLYLSIQSFRLVHYKLFYLNSLLLDEIHISKISCQMYYIIVDIPENITT